MKYLVLFVFSVMLLSGRDYDDDAIVERAKEIEKNRIAAKNKETLKVIEEHIMELLVLPTKATAKNVGMKNE